MKSVFTCIFLLILSVKSFAIISKNRDSISRDYKIVYFYSYGLMGFENKNVCIEQIQFYYGFSYKCIAGCIVTKHQVNKCERHNRKVEKTLNRRHGKNWRVEYNEKIAQCVN